jgi:hypothetical protein
MKKLDLTNKKHQTLAVLQILMYWASGDNQDLYEIPDSEERQILAEEFNITSDEDIETFLNTNQSIIEDWTLLKVMPNNNHLS